MFDGTVEGQPRTMRYSYNWPLQGHKYGNFPWSWQRSANPTVRDLLYHGTYTWDRYLRKGLNPAETAALGWLPAGEPRKWFIAAGSDAHGDFNFRRHGCPCLDRWCDVPVTDTAIGNPRNLVSMKRPAGPPVVAPEGGTASSGPRRYTNQEVIAALRSGNFPVTDGPALRIAIDRNRNGEIDDNDIPMGATFEFYPGEHIPLLVEWKSTPEFGPITQIDVYVGNTRVTFALKVHGLGVPPGGGRNTQLGAYEPDPSGALQVQLTDQFGRFNRQDVPAEAAYHGIARVYIGPAQFRLADGAAPDRPPILRSVSRRLLSKE